MDVWSADRVRPAQEGTLVGDEARTTVVNGPAGDGTAPLIPDYRGACLSNVVPALLERPDDPPEWVPAPAVDADRVVLILLDGLGWEQLQARRHLAPTLCGMEGGRISS